MLKRIKSFLLENTSTRQTILKNTTWLLGGQIIGRLLRATIVIYAARVLGAHDWGTFSYALGIAAFLTVFTDIGVNAYITRELARGTGLERQYLGTAFAIKLILIFIVCGITLTLLPWLSIDEQSKILIPILLLVFIVDTIRDLGSALSRALERMEIEAGVGIFTNFAIALLGFILLRSMGSATALAYAYAIGSGLGLLAMIGILWPYCKGISRTIQLHLAPEILRTAWPFGLLGIMGAVMLNSDIIIIGWLRTVTEVGYYAATQKIILLAYVLPGMVASSVFPVTARLVGTNPEKAKLILEQATTLMLIIAIPIAVLTILFAPWIIELLFGVAYLPGLTTLKILALTMIIVFPSTILGNALFAYNRERHLATFVCASIATNIIFDLLLIPTFGIAGAAVGTIITQLISNIWLYITIKKINNMKILPQLKTYLSMVVKI